ncbi:uncharacterized protein BO80DRAFT_131639 [Aspergillus ibericus CBS 121593]|uniref:Uncharacterized protein n=1 Tax=Aspergillus ibericus CBS 121593 TaxID=1448316 RepID=A0A395HBC2_9EURO|nr:hypothetical protein BO80DRAFT_131639 [Aspergillus ibericus CBS 121593]RAL05241.1 hypothetical protein BO80DRAFT_131639 [Aspergillus ibericus CBS 121593]
MRKTQATAYLVPYPLCLLGIFESSIEGAISSSVYSNPTPEVVQARDSVLSLACQFQVGSPTGLGLRAKHLLTSMGTYLGQEREPQLQNLLCGQFVRVTQSIISSLIPRRSCGSVASELALGSPVEFRITCLSSV